MEQLTLHRPVFQGLKRPHVSVGLREAAEVLLVTIAFFIYFGVRGLVIERVAEAERHAEKLVSLERWLGIFWEPRAQDLIVHHEFLRAAANSVYLYGHGPVILVLALVLYTRHRGVYLWTRNAMLLSGAIGLVIYFVYPVAPPRLLADGNFVDTVLDEYHVSRVLMPHFLTNEYAAVPSLHFGWNLLMGVAVWKAFDNVWARIFAILMPAAMLLAIVTTANHYILDAVAGTFVVIAGALLAVYLRQLGEQHLTGGGFVSEGLRWLLGVQPHERRVPVPAYLRR